MKTQYPLNGRRPLFPDDSLDYHYTRAKMVGLGISTVREIVTQVCELIVDCIWQKCVIKHMPPIEQDLKIRWRKWMTGGSFLSVEIAIDGCHILIKCPPGGAASCKEYHNFKNCYSVVLMAMVDLRYRFFWGSCGFPANSHDAIIFRLRYLGKVKRTEFSPRYWT